MAHRQAKLYVLTIRPGETALKDFCAVATNLVGFWVAAPIGDPVPDFGATTVSGGQIEANDIAR